MICKNCGATLPDGTKFCTKCGSKIVAEPAFNAPQQQFAPQQQQVAPQQPVNPVAYGGQAPAKKGFGQLLQEKPVLKIILPIVALLVVAGIAVGAYFLFFADKKGGGEGEGGASSYKQVLDNYISAVANKDAKKYKSLYPKAVIELMKSEGYTEDVVEANCEEMVRLYHEAFAFEFGDDFKLTYEVTNEEKVEKEEATEELDDFYEACKEAGIKVGEVEDAVEVTVKLNIKGSEGEDSKTSTMLFIKFDGSWFSPDLLDG